MKFFAVFAAILALAAAMPAQTEWSLHQITSALANPNTDAALIPYLEHALNQFMDAIHAGFEIDTIAIPLPAIVPEPAVVEDAPATPAAVASSPLVQIIINVNQQDESSIVESPVPAPAVVIEPTPVAVVDGPAESIIPTPVIVVEEVAEEVAPEVPIAPPAIEIDTAPAVVDPSEFNPIDVIAVGSLEPSQIPVNPASEAGSIWV